MLIMNQLMASLCRRICEIVLWNWVWDDCEHWQLTVVVAGGPRLPTVKWKLLW